MTLKKKTLWEKEKILVISIFSFSLSVFYSIKERNHFINSKLSSANALGLGQSKICHMGKGKRRLLYIIHSPFDIEKVNLCTFISSGKGLLTY